MASASSDDPYYESEGADDRKIIVRMLNYKTTNETIKEYFGELRPRFLFLFSNDQVLKSTSRLISNYSN